MQRFVLLATSTLLASCGHAEYMATAIHAPSVYEQCGHAVFESSAFPGAVNVATHMQAYAHGCAERTTANAIAAGERRYIESLNEGAQYYASQSVEAENPKLAHAQSLYGQCKGKPDNSKECAMYMEFECERGNPAVCDQRHAVLARGIDDLVADIAAKAKRDLGSIANMRVGVPPMRCRRGVSKNTCDIFRGKIEAAISTVGFTLIDEQETKAIERSLAPKHRAMFDDAAVDVEIGRWLPSTHLFVVHVIPTEITGRFALIGRAIDVTTKVVTAVATRDATL